MTHRQFTRESVVPAPREETFAWHERDGAFDRLTPPWEAVRLIERKGGIETGATATIEMRVGPFRRHWRAEHLAFERGVRFEDVQVSGPFAHWHHRHEFSDAEGGGCVMRDAIDYRLPLAPISHAVAGGFTERKLAQMFHYRHATLADDLARHGAVPDRRPRRVAISGASGLVGTALSAALKTGGHEVVQLVRRPPQADDEVQWDTERGVHRPERLAGFDAVVHLAGAGIADRRWTDARMRLIEESRTQGTAALVRSLADAGPPPRAFLAASAIGIYGDRGAEVCTEETPRGTGFLADVGERWEAASLTAADHGMRVVRLRIGLILSPRGGLLARLLPIFRLGLGGPIGSGLQRMSWISIDDIVWAFHRALVDEDLEGALNLTAPRPVSNRAFSRTLGRALGRPAVLPAPRFAILLAFGRMARETALAGAHVEPRRLQEIGHDFRDTDLESALRRLVGRVRLPQ